MFYNIGISKRYLKGILLTDSRDCFLDYEQTSIELSQINWQVMIDQGFPQHFIGVVEQNL
jgi:hypothetical protein